MCIRIGHYNTSTLIQTVFVKVCLSLIVTVGCDRQELHTLFHGVPHEAGAREFSSGSVEISLSNVRIKLRSTLFKSILEDIDGSAPTVPYGTVSTHSRGAC